MTRVFLTGGSGLDRGRARHEPDRARRRGGRAGPLGQPPSARSQRAAPGWFAATCSTRRRWRPAWRAASCSTTWPASTRCAPPTPRRCSTSTCGAPRRRCEPPPGRTSAGWCSRPRPPRWARRRAPWAARRSPHRGSYLSIYERSKHEGELAAFAAARRAGVELVSVNPSSVQGPGRAGGTGRILIAYLNGRLRAFVDTHISIVDIDDCVEGHLLGAERGVPGERYVLNGATLSSREALDIGRRAGRGPPRRALPPAASRRRRRRAGRGGLPRCAAASRRSAARWCARSCTATATTAPARRGSSGLRYTPGGRDVPAHDRLGGGARGSWVRAKQPSAGRRTMEHENIQPSRSSTTASRRGATTSPTRPRRTSSPTSPAARARASRERRAASARASEALPDSPEKHVERRFSEGIERSPTSE